MYFKEKYPTIPRIDFNPLPDVQVEENVTRASAAFTCSGCRKPTTFRLSLSEDYPPIPCCSDECKAAILSPPSSEAEHSHDSRGVEGSTPSVGTPDPVATEAA